MTIIPSGTGWPNPQRVETGGAGGITEVTATDASVTVTNPTGPIVGLSANGGAQPSISDALILAGSTVVTLDTTNGWGYTFTVGDFIISAQRGTDLSIVDGGGEAALHSVAGGDFAMHVHLVIQSISLDGGSTDARYLNAFADASPDSGDFSSQGFDTVIPVYATFSAIRAQALSQPWFGVPADSLVTDLLLALNSEHTTGTDTFRVTPTLTIWKLGPLPT